MRGAIGGPGISCWWRWSSPSTCWWCGWALGGGDRDGTGTSTGSASVLKSESCSGPQGQRYQGFTCQSSEQFLTLTWFFMVFHGFSWFSCGREWFGRFTTHGGEHNHQAFFFFNGAGLHSSWRTSSVCTVRRLSGIHFQTLPTLASSSLLWARPVLLNGNSMLVWKRVQQSDGSTPLA